MTGLWEEYPIILDESDAEPYELPNSRPKQKPEAVQTTALLKGIHKAGGFAYKIPDPVGDFKTAARPFDVMACYGGRSIAIECKWQAKLKAFNKNILRDVQVDGLTNHSEAGGVSLVVLFAKHANRIHMMSWPWQEFNEIGSVKKSELEGIIEDGKAIKKAGDAFTVDAWIRSVSSR